MKSIQQFINEKLQLKNIKRYTPIKYEPIDWNELCSAVQEIIKEYKNNNKLDEIINFNCINVSKMDAMDYVFDGEEGIKKIDISEWDVSNVTDMSFMFSHCHNLEYIKFGNNFNTSKVNEMSAMFKDCPELKQLEGFENIDVSNVKTIRYMFYDCENLNQDLSKLDFSHIKDSQKRQFAFYGTLYEFDEQKYKKFMPKIL